MILLINLFEEKLEIKITRVSTFSDLHFLQNIIFLLFEILWRKVRDSNPWIENSITGFRDQLIKPL